MTISQVALSNTFNEFRTTVNDISNTVNAFDVSLTSNTITSNTITSATLTANSVVVANNISAGGSLASGILTAGRMPFVTSGGVITNNGNFTIDEPTLNITTTGGLTLGGNKISMVAANGDIISTGNVNLTTTTGAYGARIDAGHIHARTHLGAGGDVETWATAKGDNAQTHKVVGIANTDGPIDMLVVNQSDGSNAYAEFIAIHASGNTADGWVSMGVNSTNYAEGAFGITKADDAYVLYSAPVGTTESGDLVIGTSSNGTGNKIIFSADGFDDPANNQQMIIHPAEKVAISINTQSSNTTTGALVVNGGIGLLGNLNVGGNVAITGTITLGGGGNTVSTSSLSVDNPIVFLGANNAADTFDLGIVGEYASNGKKFAGLVRDASDSGVFKLFANNSSTPANTVNFSDANVAYGTLLLNTVRANGGTVSTSNTTGSVIVTGGVGVAGAVNADTVRVLATTAAANTTSGALVVAGGVGIGGTLISANIAGTTGATISSFITDGTLAANNDTTVPTTAAVRAYVASAGGGGGSTFNIVITDVLATAAIQPIDVANGYNPSSGATYSYTGRGKYGTNGNCFFHSSGFARSSPTASGIAIRPYTVNTTTGAITVGTRSDVFLNTSTSVGLSTTWMAQDQMSGKTMWYGNSGWTGASTNEFGYAFATIGETGTVSNIGSAIDYASHYRNGTMGMIGASNQTGWYGISAGYGQNNPPDSAAAFNRWNFTGSTPSSIGIQRSLSNTSTSYHVSMQGQNNLNASSVDVGAMAYYRNTSNVQTLRVFNSTLSAFTDYASPWNSNEYAFQLSSGRVIHYGTGGTYVYSAYNSRTLVDVVTPSWITGRQMGGSSISWIAQNTWMASTSDNAQGTSFICFSINPTTYALTFRQLEFGGQGIFQGSNISAMVSGASQQHLVLATNSSDGSSNILVYENPFAGTTGV